MQKLLLIVLGKQAFKARVLENAGDPPAISQIRLYELWFKVSEERPVVIYHEPDDGETVVRFGEQVRTSFKATHGVTVEEGIFDEVPVGSGDLVFAVTESAAESTHMLARWPMFEMPVGK